MMSEEVTLQPRRLHPTSVLFRVGNYAKQLAVPLIVVVLLARGDSWELYASVFVIPLAMFEFWRYLTTTYRITDDQLVVRSGAIFRSERHIPLQRIQNIDLVQNVVHRLLHVAEVRIETASGSEPEAILKVVALDEVDRLRQRIFTRGDSSGVTGVGTTEDQSAAAEGQPAGQTEELVLLHLSASELAKHGLITYRGLVLVGVGMGLLWQLDLFEQLEDRLRDAGDLFDQVRGAGIALAIAVLVMLGFIGVTVLSVVWSIVTLYDYRLVRVGDSLLVTCGLWTRLTATIPRERIQLVSLRQSVLHRLFHRVTVSVETAGGSGDADKVPVNRRWLVPLVDEQRLASILHEIQPEIELLELDWRPLAHYARRRMVRKAMAWALLLSLPFLMVAWWASLIAAVCLLTLFIWHAYAAVRAMGYARTTTGIAFRSGVLTRRVSATSTDRLQTIRQSQSPFDRRFRMASVAVDTAGAGPAGHQIEIPYLEETVASQLRRELVADAARTDFSWA